MLGCWGAGWAGPTGVPKGVGWSEAAWKPCVDSFVPVSGVLKLLQDHVTRLQGRRGLNLGVFQTQTPAANSPQFSPQLPRVSPQCTLPVSPPRLPLSSLG